MDGKQTRAGARLRQWLKDNGRNQEWLAEQIGTHQTNVSAWILGRPLSSIAAAIAIQKVTGISIEEWLVPASDSSRSLPADESGERAATPPQATGTS